MTEQLTAAWRLGRDTVGTWETGKPSLWAIRQCLSRAGLPTDYDHVRAFQDGAKDGTDTDTGKEG